MIELFIAVAWKSALISARGLGTAWLVRGHSAAARVALLRLALVLTLALPVLVMLLPALRIETGAPPPPILLPAAADISVPYTAPAAPVIDWRLAVIGAYAAIAAVLLIRLAFDIAALSRVSRSARRVDDAGWRQALQRACPDARLLVSDRIAAPLSWGVHPVIVLNAAALERPEDAEAVLTHEAGHIRRGDWLFLILARVTAAVFWFNPLVWWLHGELVQRSEEAVDAYAVARLDRTAYASALLGFAGTLSLGAANGMMKGGLARRISLILSAQGRVRPAPALTGLAALACIAVATPLAAVELVHPQAKIIRLAMQEVTPEQTAQLPATAPAAPQAEALPMTPAGNAQTNTSADMQADSDEAEQAHQDAAQAAQDAAQARQDEAQAQADAQPAQADAAQAAKDGDGAKADAVHAKAGAEQDKAQAKADAALAKAQAKAAKAEAKSAKAWGAEAKAQALVDGALQMNNGALEMMKGASELRSEAEKLGDPAYRQQQIAVSAARGQTVTDAELQALIPKFKAKADELDQKARELQARASEMQSGA